MSILKKRFIAWKHDTKTKIKFGLSAPLFAEYALIMPKECDRFIERDIFKRMGEKSVYGVYTGEWPHEYVYNIYDALSEKFNPDFEKQTISSVYISKYKFRACHDHWVHGISWESTGVIDLLTWLIDLRKSNVDGCISRGDLIRRYKQLDNIFNTIQENGKFEKQRDRKYFRAMGEPMVNIGPDNSLFWGQGGQHRFAISHILNVPFFAQIGTVHVDGFGKLNEIRKRASHIDL